MTDLRRHPDGTPMDGMDCVPDGRDYNRCIRDQLKNVVSLLHDANERNVCLKETISKWKRDYHLVRDELLALKYGQLCVSCQLQRLSLRDGECLEVTCTTCSKTEKKETDDKARYWQRCYESLLAVHYGGGNDDGTDLGLQ